METAMYILLGVSGLALVLLVLVQQGKGAGVGFAMGGASQAMFGGSGGRDFFIKVTAAAAIAFMVACLVLGKMSSNQSGQYEGAMAGASAPAPAAPAVPATAAQPAAAAPAAAVPAVAVPAAKPAVPAAQSKK